MFKLKTWVAAAAMVGTMGAAQATLFDRGAMVYDSSLSVTWLKNWNVNGPMDWASANSWAEGLNAYGFDDWRLPTALEANGSGPCRGLGCSGSELGYMFYANWGAAAGGPYTLGTNAANLALFFNVVTLGNGAYWTGTPEAQVSGRHWAFGVVDGAQSTPLDSSALFAVAVRFGDVSAVPEVQPQLLMLLGLGAGLVLARQRARRPH